MLSHLIQNSDPAVKPFVLNLRPTLEDQLSIVILRHGILTDPAWLLEAPRERLTDFDGRETWQPSVTIVKQGTRISRSTCFRN